MSAQPVSIRPVGLLDELRNGAWLDAQVFAPLAWALTGVFPEGSSLFVGPPKVGKSWFLLALLLAIATGGRHLGIAVEQRPTLYLALEDGDCRMQPRCRRLLGDYVPIPARFEYLIRCQPGNVLATITEWLEVHQGEAPVIAVDTLGKVMPPALVGESPYQRDYRIGSALKRLADDSPGSSLIVAHHDRKAESADFIDAVSGTNGLAGAADTIVLLSRARHEAEGSLQVTGRDVPEASYAVKFRDGCRWELVGGDLASSASTAEARRAAAGLSDRSAELLAVVSHHPQGITKAEVAEKVGNMDSKTAGTYLGRLVESHRLIRLARGVYAPVPPVGSVEVLKGEALGFPHSNGYNTPTAEATP